LSVESEEDWQKLCEGPNGEIWIHKSCLKEIKKINQQRMWAKVRAHMTDRFCELESLDDLTKEQFNSEGRQSVNGKKVLLYAFKSYQLRVYGCLGSINGSRAFSAAVAVQKKTDELDDKDAKRTADRLAGVEGAIKSSAV
jgi:hypothetical protein